MFDNVDRHKKRAKDLLKYVIDTFEEQQQYKAFVDSVLSLVQAPEEEELVEFD